MNGIEERLDAAEQIIQNPDFRSSRDPGSKAGYYVFDYPAEKERMVRERIACMIKKNNKNVDGYELVVFDLYDVLIDLLEQEGLSEQCFKFEKSKGMERIIKAIGNLLLINEEKNLVIRYIQNRTPKEAVVFLIGVGKCCQILRPYQILNGLRQAVDHVPVVLFYPGDYKGQELTLV